ncbi:MAG: TetR/AcrR family transcriptional regulator [Thermoleophilaceae bacterium]|nr:TetR/AcrR family transcriptional regulator [Thermoleophilaceae bacterium]
MREGATTARKSREQELVRATRMLFDQRGGLDAPVEEIANEVGIPRGLIYRVFSSKEELYTLTVTDYLAELGELMETAAEAPGAPETKLHRAMEAYAGFCERYPAFLDASLALMRGPARQLNDKVSESVWLRLGQGMAGSIGPLARILKEGADAGVFSIEDPDYTANVLWTQALGAMHLARIRVGLREAAPGIPELFPVAPADIVGSCVDHALAAVRAPR